MSSTGLMTVSGLVSGLDIDGLLKQLQEVEERPITTLKDKKTTLSSQYSAWTDANTRILAVQQKAADLSNLASKVAMKATSSDSSATVSATNAATAGSYSFHVDSVASYHQLTTQGFANEDSISLGSGSIDITTNNKTTTINVANATLDGLRDAINNSDAGVSAFIVNDGGATPSYRLVLTSDTLGSSGKITLDTSNLAGGTAPTFNELQAANDTKITFGSGANQFSITRSSNSLTDVIPGTTINLTNDSQGKSITVKLETDYSPVKQAITDFVAQYNAYLDYAAAQNKYNPTDNTSGTLFGEYTLQEASSTMSDAISKNIAGLPSNMRSIFQIGITTNDSGKLSVDDTKLSDALNSNLQGVCNLFRDSGTTNDKLKFISATSDTKESTTGYSVNITQAARVASMTIDATGDGLAATLAQDETLTINGESITLTAGMTRDQVASAINAKSSKSGVKAILTDATGSGSGNFLTLRRTSAGSRLGISVSSNTAAASSTEIGTSTLTCDAAGANNIGTVGLDVQGTIDGVAATGYGDTLTGTSGTSKGLVVQILSSSLGDLGSVSFSQGIGSKLKSQLGFITDATTGTIHARQSTLQTEMDDIDDRVTDMEASVTAYITRMRTSFTFMEQKLSELQSQSARLSSLVTTSSD